MALIRAGLAKALRNPPPIWLFSMANPVSSPLPFIGGDYQQISFTSDSVSVSAFEESNQWQPLTPSVSAGQRLSITALTTHFPPSSHNHFWLHHGFQATGSLPFSHFIIFPPLSSLFNQDFMIHKARRAPAQTITHPTVLSSYQFAKANHGEDQLPAFSGFSPTTAVGVTEQGTIAN